MQALPPLALGGMGGGALRLLHLITGLTCTILAQTLENVNTMVTYNTEVDVVVVFVV
jgi:hypothetical protein